MDPEIPWPDGAYRAQQGGFEVLKKSPFIKRVGFGSRVWARGSGSSIKKTRPEPDPLPFLTTMVLPLKFSFAGNLLTSSFVPPNY